MPREAPQSEIEKQLLSSIADPYMLGRMFVRPLARYAAFQHATTSAFKSTSSKSTRWEGASHVGGTFLAIRVDVSEDARQRGLCESSSLDTLRGHSFRAGGAASEQAIVRPRGKSTRPAVPLEGCAAEQQEWPTAASDDLRDAVSDTFAQVEVKV